MEDKLNQIKTLEDSIKVTALLNNNKKNYVKINIYLEKFVDTKGVIKRCKK
jgi:uncharacterized protein YerC